MAQRLVRGQYQQQQAQHYHVNTGMEVDASYEPRHRSSRAAADSMQDHSLVGSDSEEDEEYEDEGPMMAGGRPVMNGGRLGPRRMELDGTEGDLDGIDGEIIEDDAASDSSFSDSLSSSPSIPSSDDIDFSLVYALHTFLANVDGQASVVKGDHLTLLDDQNSYWWLIRVLKTQAVGYIPAENIETPFERLARLNKHRNVDLSSANSHDHISGPTSSLARTRFSKRLAVGSSRVRSPLAEGQPAPRRGPPPPAQPGPGRYAPPAVPQNPGFGKGKNVAFAAPTYFENSGNEWSDEEEDEEGSFEEGEGEEIEEDEEGESGSGEEWEGEGEGAEGHRDAEEEEANARARQLAATPVAQPAPQEAVAPQQSTQPLQPTQALQAARLANKASSDSLSAKDEARSQLGRGPSPIQRAQMGPQQAQQGARGPSTSSSPGGQSPVEGRISPFGNRSASLSPALEQTPSDSGHGHHPRGSPSAPQGQTPFQAPARKQLRPFDELVDGPSGARGSATKKLTLTPSIASDQAYAHDDGAHLQRLSSSASSTDSRRLAGDKRLRDDPADSLDGHRSAGSVDSHAGSDDVHGAKSGKESKKLRKEREAADDGGKKRKGGGLLSGLFGRKKDKKSGRKGGDGDDDSARGSLDSRESAGSPIMGDLNGRGSPRLQQSHHGDSRRHSKTDMFSTDAALRQQQIEAQEVLYRQFGIQHRQPGDQANQLVIPRPQGHSSQHTSPQSNPLSPNLTTSSTSSGTGPRNVRPGSLIGSPSMIPGFEGPELKVLRIFAGELIASESIFKTVLLNETTTTSDLIKQAMQRFHLPSEPGDQKDYYLTVKDAVGEVTTLNIDQRPLAVFESMNDDLGRNAILPSVNRSSVGSMSSISSNLSSHPAASRLGHGDFSDDTAVKLYINRFATVKPSGDRLLATIQEDGQMDESDTATVTSPSPRDSQLSNLFGSSDHPGAAPHSTRFAMCIQVYPSDLPDNLGFDPSSNAIIPRHVLQERGLQSPTSGTAYREKVMFFPRNVNVFEAIEHALDAFGISDGVVDGGDDVEDKLAKRRSISRVRYALSVKRNGKEHAIAPNSKVVDAYTSPPSFRPIERTSKEAKRRSLDAAFALGTTADLQPSDPVFVLRKAHSRASVRHSGLAAAVADELAMHRQRLGSNRPVPDRSSSTNSGRSNYMTPSEELGTPPVWPQDQPAGRSEKETIAAQRAAFLSANRKDDADGEDAATPTSTDVGALRPRLRNVASTSEMSVGSDGYASAPESPTHIEADQPRPSRPSREDDADEDAIEALRTAPLSIGSHADDGRRGSQSSQRAATPDRDGPSADRATHPIATRALANDSAPLDSATSTPTAPGPSRRHVPQSSQASFSSSRSSTTGTNSPTTPITATSPTGDSTYTPISSATRHGADSRASHRQPIVYRDDFGLDVVMNIVEHTASLALAEKRARRTPTAPLVSMADHLAPMPSLAQTEGVSDEVKGWYSGVDGTLSGLDRRLDELLDSVLQQT